MPEISENSHKISAAQLFCILLLLFVVFGFHSAPFCLTRLLKQRRKACCGTH